MPNTSEISPATLAVVMGEIVFSDWKAVWAILREKGWLVMDAAHATPTKLESALLERQPLLLVGYGNDLDQIRALDGRRDRVLVATFPMGPVMSSDKEYAAALNDFNRRHFLNRDQMRRGALHIQKHVASMLRSPKLQERLAEAA